jgi:hypothetical protein
MTVEALMDLRMRVDEMLVEHRAKLIEQLESIAVVSGTRVVRGGGGALRGRKVPPKYRALQAKPGQVEAQDLFGLLQRSNVARNSTIF